MNLCLLIIKNRLFNHSYSFLLKKEIIMKEGQDEKRVGTKVKKRWNKKQNLNKDEKITKRRQQDEHKEEIEKK